MTKLFILIILSALVIQGFAAPKKMPESVRISYQTIVNGKLRTDGSLISLLCSSSASRSWVENDSKKLLPSIAKETSCIDFTTKTTFQIAQFSGGKVINTPMAFSKYPELTETGETEVILGYACKHLKTSLRSNSIDIWYTTELGVKGTPAMAYGVPNGLVLKVIRNGNYR